ncbi:hypothetical protein ACPWT1_11750 [Ramlibacter sp. MMS24-I3-19]
MTLTVKVAVSTPPLATPPLSLTANEKACVPSAPMPDDSNCMPRIWASV